MSALTLTERIEAAYDEAIRLRREIDEARKILGDLETVEKIKHADEWTSAKNNDVRALLLASWLADHDAYHQGQMHYSGVRSAYRLALLEIERLKLLVEATKAEGGGS